jgi:hypothetical protein
LLNCWLYNFQSSSPLKSAKKVEPPAAAPSNEKSSNSVIPQQKPDVQALTLEESDVVVERSSLELLFASEEEDQLQDDAEVISDAGLTMDSSVSESISSGPAMSTLVSKPQQGNFQTIKTSFFFASTETYAQENPKTPTRDRVLKAPRIEKDRKTLSSLGPEHYTNLKEEEEEGEEEEEEEDKGESGQIVQSSKQKSVVSNVEPRLTRSVSLNNLSAAARTRSKSKNLKRGIVEEGESTLPSFSCFVCLF